MVQDPNAPGGAPPAITGQEVVDLVPPEALVEFEHTMTAAEIETANSSYVAFLELALPSPMAMPAASAEARRERPVEAAPEPATSPADRR